MNPLPPLSDEEYADLKASIAEHGVFVPVFFDQDGNIIDGHHRIGALTELGKDLPDSKRAEIAVIDDNHRAQIVTALNLHRRNVSAEERRILMARLKPTERVALASGHYEKEKAEAKERQRQSGGDRKSGSETVSEPISGTGEAAAMAAEEVGWSGATLRRANAVMKAAQEDPERFGDLPKMMDDNESVRGAWEELNRRRTPEERKKRSRGTKRDHPQKKGGRTRKQAISSLKQVAIGVDAAAGTFENGALGDLSQLVAYEDAWEPLSILFDATQKLAAHVRTVKRYQKEVTGESA